jgi:CBS-domain-containing membrane protein
VQVMEDNQIRRVPVVDDRGECCGIVAQADIARHGTTRNTLHLVKDLSQPSTGSSSVGVQTWRMDA